MNVVPKDPDFAARVRESFAKQRIMAYLGAELCRVEPGYCEIQLPYKPELTQQHHYFHGGVIGTIADSAGGYAGFTLMDPDTTVLTVEYKLNLLAPGDGERLVARGRVKRAGRSLIVSEADVAVLKDDAETACATMLQTLMTLRGKPEVML